MQALFHMTYRNAFCGWLPILSFSKGRSKFMWCLFHQQVHTENTETHACMQTLQTGGSRGLDSHRCLSGSGTTPVHVTSEWQYSLSRCTQTHTLTPKRFMVSSFCVDMFGWKAPSCLWHQNNIKKKDKKIPHGHRDHNVTIYHLCGEYAGAALNY